jgi:hypothetical protein
LLHLDVVARERSGSGAREPAILKCAVPRQVVSRVTPRTVRSPTISIGRPPEVGSGRLTPLHTKGSL